MTLERLFRNQTAEAELEKNSVYYSTNKDDKEVKIKEEEEVTGDGEQISNLKAREYTVTGVCMCLA
jgi:CRISPR/Cas system-associated protein Csx1